jgi:hypothetical protein
MVGDASEQKNSSSSSVLVCVGLCMNGFPEGWIHSQLENLKSSHEDRILSYSTAIVLDHLSLDVTDLERIRWSGLTRMWSVEDEVKGVLYFYDGHLWPDTGNLDGVGYLFGFAHGSILWRSGALVRRDLDVSKSPNTLRRQKSCGASHRRSRKPSLATESYRENRFPIICGTAGQAIWVYTLIKVVGRDVWIGIWAFVLAIFSVTLWEKSETGRKVEAGQIWWLFPKFVIGFLVASIVVTWAVGHAKLLICKRPVIRRSWNGKGKSESVVISLSTASLSHK